jgi:hypothetical protein
MWKMRIMHWNASFAAHIAVNSVKLLNAEERCVICEYNRI